MNNTLMQLSLSAAGSPSDVKTRITDQATMASAGNPDQSAIIGALKATIEKQLAPISEDATIAVTASVSIVFADPPATVTQKQEAQRTEVASLKAANAGVNNELALVRLELADMRKKFDELSAAKVSGDTSVSGS